MSIVPGNAGAADDVWGILAVSVELQLGLSLHEALLDQARALLSRGPSNGLRAAARVLPGPVTDALPTPACLVFTGQAVGIVGAHLLPEEVCVQPFSCISRYPGGT